LLLEYVVSPETEVLVIDGVFDSSFIPWLVSLMY